ncbi:MAG: tetratricopeptide repeat protein [Vulcanimicrobiaceae bacterium]
MSQLERPRIISVFANAMPYPVILVDAPEGAGKTIALQQFLDALRITPATCTLTADDASLVTFVRTFAQALRPIAPGIHSSSANAIEEALQVGLPHEKLAEWLLEHLSGVAAALVIDGIQHAQDDARVAALLQTLVEKSPPSLKWIILSRNGFALPIERWIAENRATAPVTASQLTFTWEEARQVAALAGIDEPSARAGFELTGGTPLTFALAMRVRESVERLSALQTRDPQAQYALLAREAFSTLDTRLADALLVMSVLASIDEPLVRALVPDESLWERLERIAADGLLFTRESNAVLRFRDLFRSVLIELRIDREKAAIGSAATRVASALEACDRAEEAVQLLLKTQDDNAIRRLCELHGLRLLDRGRRDLLQDALDRLAGSDYHQHAEMLVIHAIIESRRGRVDTSQAWFMQALDAASEGEQKAKIAYRYSLDLVRHGRRGSVELLEPYEDNVLLPSALRASVQSTLATGYVLEGRFADARRCMAKALRLASRSADDELRARIYHHIAWCALFTGDVKRAKRYGARAVELALANNLYEIAAWADSVLYNVAYDIEDDCDASLAILSRILDSGMKAGSLQVRLFALLGSVDIYAERGDTAALERLEATLQGHEVDFDDVTTSETLVPAKAMTLAGCGDFARACDILMPTANRQITPDRRALRQSEIALYAAAAGYTDAADVAMHEIAELDESLNPQSRRVMRTRLNLALAQHLSGCTEMALATLGQVERSNGAMSPRLHAYFDAARALIARWSGASNHLELFESLARLDAVGFGGIATLLSAMPRAPICHLVLLREARKG